MSWITPRNSSRSRSHHRRPVSTPRSGPSHARHTRCEAIRCSSTAVSRIHCPRSGVSSPIIFTTASPHAADGVELEVLRQQDALKVRVALELDPHEVPGLPLVVVRGVPEAREALDLGIVVGDVRGDLDHAPVVVVLDVVGAIEPVLPIDCRDAGEMLEADRLLQVRADRDQVVPVDRHRQVPRPEDLAVEQFRAERRLEASEHLLLDQGDRTARDHHRRPADDRAHIWMTSSFLSAYWVATNMIPRKRKIENLPTGDAELRSPPHANAQRRRNTAATSKTTKIRANM